MAVARSLQVFGQVISSLASKNKQVGGTDQADIEIPYKESVCVTNYLYSTLQDI